MTSDELHVLERIALALERQVEQYEENVARNEQLRAQNIQRHEQQRDAELAEVREVNRQLIEQMGSAVAVAKDTNARLREFELQATSDRGGTRETGQ